MKELKYQSYLEKYENCPMKECKEKDVVAFRWAYSDITDDDFLPNVFSERFPNKTLDSTDLHCTSFALSMFESLDSARDRYNYFYKKNTRPSAKEAFKKQKGDSVALLHLKKEDGVSDEPNSFGHFSFFEYKGFDYLQRLKKQDSIFV